MTVVRYRSTACLDTWSGSIATRTYVSDVLHCRGVAVCQPRAADDGPPYSQVVDLVNFRRQMTALPAAR